VTVAQPRLTLAEFETEVRLSGSKYLLVEGPADQRFYSGWIRTAPIPLDRRPLVMTADRIDVDGGLLISIGLTDGQRSRIIFLSQFAERRSLDILCVADRDCGEGVTTFSASTLAWTDFPAVESYGFEPETLDRLNELFLGNRLPSGSSLVSELSEPLLDLYAVRSHNPSMLAPKIAAAGVRSGGTIAFDLNRSIPPHLASVAPTYLRPAFADARAHAYGHDICELLLLLYSNPIRNQSGVGSVGMLENALRAAILLSGVFDSSILASRILAWLL